MKFALVNNQRHEATPKTKGICPACNKPVIAKCGKHNQWHWAHEIALGCKNDRWENEGPWHQKWKNQFPVEWQEKRTIINNEKNIADIKTPQGLVIEFQHSRITSEEQKARETAYKNMLWVVDGTRLKYDFYRFQTNIKKYSKERLDIQNNIKLFTIDFYNKIFPKNWLNCSVPVIFDFLGEEEEKNANTFQKYLYFLLPQYNKFPTFLFFMPRKNFVPFIKNYKWKSFYYKLSFYIYTEMDLNKYITKIETQQYSCLVCGALNEHNNTGFCKKCQQKRDFAKKNYKNYLEKAKREKGFLDEQDKSNLKNIMNNGYLLYYDIKEYDDLERYLCYKNNQFKPIEKIKNYLLKKFLHKNNEQIFFYESFAYVLEYPNCVNNFENHYTGSFAITNKQIIFLEKDTIIIYKIKDICYLERKKFKDIKEKEIEGIVFHIKNHKSHYIFYSYNKFFYEEVYFFIKKFKLKE